MVVVPTVLLALGVVGISLEWEVNGAFLYVSNEDLVGGISPAWLDGLLIGIAFAALVLLPPPGWRHSKESWEEMRALQRQIVCSSVLIGVFLAKMVVFGQYSFWVYLAIVVSVAMLVTALRSRSQRQRLLAVQS